MSGINKDLNYVSGSHEAIAVGSTAGGTGFTAGKMALTVGNRPRSATMAILVSRMESRQSALAIRISQAAARSTPPPMQ